LAETPPLSAGTPPLALIGEFSLVLVHPASTTASPAPASTSERLHRLLIRLSLQ
jgi:hypothetical protein